MGLYGLARMDLRHASVQYWFAPPMCADPVVKIGTLCPKCSGRGLARAVCIKHIQRTVTYECENCHDRWEETDQIASPSWSTPEPIVDAQDFVMRAASRR